MDQQSAGKRTSADAQGVASPRSVTMSELMPGSRAGGLADILVGAALAALTWWALYRFAIGYQQGAHAGWFLLWGVSATVTGWLIGIVLSPYNVSEKKDFSALTKTVYGFITGYLLSKLDPLLTRVLSEGTGTLDPRLLPTILIALCCLLIAIGNTYVSRSYWIDTGLARRVRQRYALPENQARRNTTDD